VYRSFWGCLILVSPALRADLPEKSVLVLHSYYKGCCWTGDEGGLDSVLLPEPGAGNISIEYMDARRFDGSGKVAAAQVGAGRAAGES
jgi:hypothetical protein